MKIFPFENPGFSCETGILELYQFPLIVLQIKHVGRGWFYQLCWGKTFNFYKPAPKCGGFMGKRYYVKIVWFENPGFLEKPGFLSYMVVAVRYTSLTHPTFRIFMTVITYSPAYTLVPTYECFNRCAYCNFRAEPGQSPWLTLKEIDQILKTLQNKGICEILILSGEVHPRSSMRSLWFQRIYDLCKLALSLGFLPHTNAGPLSYEEMAQLKQVNVSMGLMLEQLTPKLLQTVHRHAPSKLPEVRLQQLEWAGELRIPFTTGLLLGIGETQQDWWESLEAIARIHQRWGHIQEVILQPYSPGERQIWDAPGFDLLQLPEIIATARQILPADITIQIPPNLVQDDNWLLACLAAGARDLGGIGPKDEVNPDYPHPEYQRLQEILQPAGWKLIPRLPVYPQYDEWLSVELQASVKRWRMG